MSSRVKRNHILHVFVPSNGRCINCGKMAKDPVDMVNHKKIVKEEQPVCSKNV